MAAAPVRGLVLRNSLWHLSPAAVRKNPCGSTRVPAWQQCMCQQATTCVPQIPIPEEALAAGLAGLFPHNICAWPCRTAPQPEACPGGHPLLANELKFISKAVEPCC